MCKCASPGKKYMLTEDDKMFIKSKEIVSKVGYLVGVPRQFFEDGKLLLEVYDSLEAEQDARIVRNLCHIYTMLNRHFSKIQGEMKTNVKNLDTIEETEDAIKVLQEADVDIINANFTVNKYRPMISREIRKRIIACAKFFPDWVMWEYIEKLFQFPVVEQDKLQCKICQQFVATMDRYPFGMYLKWNFSIEDYGNILCNDEKFLNRLYQQNKTDFSDVSKVRQENKFTQQNIERFLAQSQKTVALVDCENCNPLKFYALLQSLSPEALPKIQKIILFDDVNASSIWRLIDRYTDATIDHCMTERVLGVKSVVDANLIVRCCQEHYVGQADSFLLFSSDSDYWALIRNLTTARFFVMFEHEKTSNAMLDHLKENDVPYCFIDRFYHSEASKKLREDVVSLECDNYVKQHALTYGLNLNTMLSNVLASTCISMSEQEQKAFKERLFKSLSLKMDDNGVVSISIPRFDTL